MGSDMQQATIIEIAEALGVVRTTAVRRALREGWPYTEEKGAGGKTKIFAVEQLPKDVRQALLLKREAKTDTFTDIDIEAGEQPLSRVWHGDLIPMQSRPQIAATDEEKHKGFAKYAVIKEYLAFLNRAASNRKTRARDEFITLYRSGHWPDLQATLGDISWKTIEGWKCAIIRSGGNPLAVIDRRGKHLKGTSKVTVEQAEILRTFAYHPNKMRISTVIHWSKKVMAARNMPQISDATCRRFLNKLRDSDYPKWVFYREGEQALEDECGYTIRRDWSKVAVGDLLTADGHKCNFNVVNPATGKPARPTLILFYDCKSNMPLGWSLMFSENTEAIHVALMRSILVLGKMPQVVYLDNGRAFKGAHFTKSFDEGFIAGLYAQLGITTMFATAYHGQSKPVERFFGSMLEFESLLPTYIGNSIDNKPARMHRGEKLHRRLWEKYCASTSALSLRQVNEILAAWFDDYAMQPQRGHLDGSCPAEVFVAGKGPGVDRDVLTALMMKAEIKHISKTGITFQGAEYYHPALYGRRGRVVIRYDLMDTSSLYVFDSDGSYLCKATPQTGTHPAARLLGTAEDEMLLEQELATKNRLKTSTVGEARKILQEEVLPTYDRNMRLLGVERHLIEKTTQQATVTCIDMAKAKREAAEAIQASKDFAAEQLRRELMDLSNADRYERLLEMDAQGIVLTEEWVGFMAYYERTDEYERLADYWDERRNTYGLMYRASAANTGG